MSNTTNSQHGEYTVKGYQTVTWEKLLNLKEPPMPSPSGVPLTGIGSFLSKLNIYFYTRNYFLQYLQFYSSYNGTYEQMYNVYKTISMNTGQAIDTVCGLEDMKGIENEYENIIRGSINAIKGSKVKQLYPIYLTFFKNIEYFKDFANGYSFCFDGKYYANVLGSHFNILMNSDCVEFDEVKDKQQNFRLYPFIPLDVNPNAPVLELAIFGNNKWLSPIEFVLPYDNPDKPNYKYSVNSIKISKSIKELDCPELELVVEMEYKSYYWNQKLFPATDSPVKKKMYLSWVVKPKEMVGVPLFVTDMEWIDKKN